MPASRAPIHSQEAIQTSVPASVAGAARTDPVVTYGQNASSGPRGLLTLNSSRKPTSTAANTSAALSQSPRDQVNALTLYS